MTTTKLIWKLRKNAIRWSLQIKRVGGGGWNILRHFWGVCRSPICVDKSTIMYTQPSILS